MKREDLDELHYVCFIVNVPSILEKGILSHNGVAHLEHKSFALQDVQTRRRSKPVSDERSLHDYVNLYFWSRNITVYSAQHRYGHASLCVLRVLPDVLDLPGVFVTDRNAVSNGAKLLSPAELLLIDKDVVRARSWKKHEDQADVSEHKSAMCAEVLVPDRVEQRLVFGAYISCYEGQRSLKAIAPELKINAKPDLFFQ